MRRTLCVVLAVVGCSSPREAAPTPPVAPAPVAVDAGLPEPVVETPPEPAPIDVVAAFPEPEPADVTTDDGLISLLLANPVHAEEALAEAQSPDAFRIALLAGFARARGEKTFDVKPERVLPLLDAGVATTVDAGADAWVAEDEAPLTVSGKVVRALPLNTQVKVATLKATTATIEVPLTSVAIFGSTGHQPERRTVTLLRGDVKLSHLRNAPIDLDALLTDARKPVSFDDDQAKLQAIALWQRAWRIERSPRTREGLLRAGFAARRASTVVTAALAHDFAPVAGLTLEWGCADETGPRPGKCLKLGDERQACPTDSAKDKKRREARAATVGALGSKQAWLHFTVDARTPRQLLLISTPLALVDPCADFQEVAFEGGNGRVRRLSFPLGPAKQEVWLPVERTLGVEHALISAASEQHAVEWIRARERYRWTIGGPHELQVSLSLNSTNFSVPKDVGASMKVVPPERSCDCSRDSPQ